MAKQENTSTSNERTFHGGMFKISQGIETKDKLDQVSLFLGVAHDGIDEMVASGEANISALWGVAHMLEAAKALLDSANAEVTEGGVA